MTRRTPADAAARLAALDISSSVILQAPAGSGKTTILTQRFLALLGVVEVPEAILAMTFTRKAAAEMRERILGALRAAAQEGPAREEDRPTWELARAARQRALALGWRLEEHPARLRILTIDALNHSLAAAVPVGTRGAASLELVDNAAALYREVARRTLEDAESDEAVAPHSGAAFALLDNRWQRLEELLAQLLARRAEWLRHAFGAAPSALRAEVEGHLAGLAAEALARVGSLCPQPLRDEARRLAAGAAERLRAAAPAHPFAAELAPLADTPAARALGTTLGELPAWRAMAALAFVARANGDGPAFRKKVDKRNGFPADDKPVKARMMAWLADMEATPGLGEALAAVQDAPDPAFDADEARALESVLELARYAAAQLRLRFREAGKVDHTQIAFAAREALAAAAPATGGIEDGDPPVVGRVLHQGAVLQHVLVDEFQDTSYAQFQLLEGLVADWSGDDGRTLFAVGDPMQSIYQFREAEVGLFTRAKTRGIGRVRLRPLELTDNFRCHPPVVDFVNATFREVFPSAPSSREEAVPYLGFEAATVADAAVEPKVVMHALRSVDDGAADAEREALRVRAVIEEARAADPAASVAVLVSARSHAARIVDALRAAGITVQGVDLVPLGDTPVVQDLVSLTRALGAPTDRVAWLAVLRAPWCGLDLADLTRLCAGAKRATLPELWAEDARRAALSPDGRRRLERVRPTLEAALAAAAMPIALRVESSWLQLGGPSAYADAGALEDARRYLDALAGETESTGRIDAASLDALLEGLYAGSDSIAAGAVQVMTIHRAKGLEFDVVALPGLARVLNRDEPGLLEWLAWEDDDGEERLLLAPVARVRRVGEAEPRGSARATIRALRRVRRLRERARLLYVAMTRARAALHLFGTLKAKDALTPRPPGAQTALGALWPALAAEFSARWREDDGAGGQGPAAMPGLTRLRLDLPATPWPEGVAFERLSLPNAELVATPETVWAGDMARLAGTVVHRELERLARLADLPEAATVAADAPRLRALLQAEGVADADMDTALRRVVDALRATLADPRGRWMLSRHPVDDLVEHELTGLHEGRIENIVIDRSFVDAEGARWVIDYKTSWHEGGDLEAFIASRVEHYAPQLRKYRAFAARLGPQPVRTALYFPLLGGRFEECDPG